MREIKLTKGFVALVDDEDYESLSQFSWQADVKDNTVYACRFEILSTGKKRYISMHRVIMGCPEDVDHRDGNGLNNQRYNLRSATNSQNGHNCRKHVSYAGKPTSSQYRNVFWHAKDKRWCAAVRINGKRYQHQFKTELEAAACANEMLLQVAGEFAPQLNDLKIGPQSVTVVPADQFKKAC